MVPNTYRPEIDGLRAIAVLLVVFCHLGWIFPGGFVGVDVFFVISGFLITRILSKELGQNSFSLTGFWVRRIRRIMPASVVLVLATLLAGYRWLTPSELVDLGESALAQVAMISNIYFWEDTGYFAAGADTKPLLHTWSLAVEEQFYLFYPLVLMLLWRVNSRLRITLLTVALLLSLGLSCYGVLIHPEATYYLLPTRAWELLAGCLLALQGQSFPISLPQARWLSNLGLLGIILPAFTYTSQTPFPGWNAIPPVVGTVCLIFATGQFPELSIGRLLSWKPLVGLGLISYSFYLWHWPVIVYFNLRFRNLVGVYSGVPLVLSLGLAILSWWLVETPVRRSAWWASRRRLVYGALAGNLLVIAMGQSFIHTDGWISRYNAQEQLLIEDMTWKGDEYGIGLNGELEFEQLPSLGQPLETGNRLDLLAWGDSHLRTLGPLLDEFARQQNITGKIIAHRGVPPLPGVSMPYHTGVPPLAMLNRGDEVLQLLEQYRPRHLLLVCRWNVLTEGINRVDPPVSHRKYALSDDRETYSVNKPPEEILGQALGRLNDYCRERGITLWLVKQLPETSEANPVREIFNWAIGRSPTPSDTRTTLAEHLQRQARMDGVFQDPRLEGIRILDLAPALIENGEVLNYRDGRALYRDSNHLTRWGLKSLEPLFLSSCGELFPSADKVSPANTREP